MTRWCILPALLVCLAFPAVAQEASISDVFNGTVTPLSLTLKDLEDGWIQFEIAGQSDANPMMLMFMAKAEGFNSSGAHYYSKGQTVIIGGEAYLLAYTAAQPMPDAVAMAGIHEGRDIQVPEITPDTPLTLALIHLSTAGNLLNIRPADIKTELEKVERIRAMLAEERKKVAVTQSISNIRQTATAVQMFIQDNEGRFPPMNDLEQFQQAVLVYVGSKDRFKKPYTDEDYLINTSLHGKHERDIPNPTQIAVIFEATVREDGMRIVGFADGHAKRVTEEEWAKIKKQSGIE